MARTKGSRNKPKIASAAEPAIGHNSNMTAEQQKKLQSFVSQVEAREADKAQIADEIKEVYVEAKDAGFDVSIMRAVVRERRQDKVKRDLREALIDTYRHALGMLVDTPLGRAAMKRALGLEMREQKRQGAELPAADTSEQPAA